MRVPTPDTAIAAPKSAERARDGEPDEGARGPNKDAGPAGDGERGHGGPAGAAKLDVLALEVEVLGVGARLDQDPVAGGGGVERGLDGGELVGDPQLGGERGAGDKGEADGEGCRQGEAAWSSESTAEDRGHQNVPSCLGDRRLAGNLTLGIFSVKTHVGYSQDEKGRMTPWRHSG